MAAKAGGGASRGYSAAMPEAEQRLAPKLENVRATIAQAAKLAGRKADDVTLVAISKMHPAEAIRPLLTAGQRDFGENRVQEAAAKWPELRAEFPDARLHLVGQLQSNKAAEAVELFDAIHSVDRPSLIAALGKAMAGQDKRPDCFIQVNLEGGEGKGGCAPEDLSAIVAQARDAGLPLVGLMCVPPEGLESAPWFALLAKLADDHGLTRLSMGMSGDYETAVRIGATHVRVGTALFGAR
jgi:pyridoxal phosphate enzyme (YggS family)